MRIKAFKKPLYVTKPILPGKKSLNKKIKEIWLSRQLTNGGKQSEELKRGLQRYLGAKYLSLFNNGTTALMVAIKSLELKGEVITTPFTFPATIHSLTWNNIKPVFCDIKDSTMNIDSDKIEQLITKETSAILGVHIFGTPCEVDKIKNIADRYNLKIIYDAAHAFGSKINNKNVSLFGDLSVFSFHATKLFNTFEGGALVSNSKSLIKKAEILRNFGIKKPEHIIYPGLNGKMNELQSAIGVLNLKQIHREIVKRKKILNLYHKHLGCMPGIKFQEKPDNIEDSFQYLVIRIKKEKFGMSRDRVMRELANYNVFPSKYFFPLCSEYPYYKKLHSAKRKNLRVAFNVSKETMALPFFGDLTESEIKNICSIIIGLHK